MGRHPDPVRVRDRPVARPPPESTFAPDPGARNPDLSFASVDLGAVLERLGRLRQGVHSLSCFRGPQSSHVLASTFSPSPLARHPLAVRRQRAPETAHPEEVLCVVIPGPVTRDPRNVIPFRLLIRWDFIDLSR